MRDIYLKDPGPAPIRFVDGAVGGLGVATPWWWTSRASTIRRRSNRSGNFHSDALHVVERYTRISAGPGPPYEATIEDPKVFTRPWKMSMPLYRRQPDAQLMDFKCVEFVEELNVRTVAEDAAHQVMAPVGRVLIFGPVMALVGRVLIFGPAWNVRGGT